MLRLIEKLSFGRNLPPCVRLRLLILIIPTVFFNSNLLTQQNNENSAPTTLKTTTRLAQIDVVVMDSHGRPVIGLTNEDFRIDEDDKRQSVRSFEVHQIAPETGHVALKVPSLSPNTYLNVKTAPETGTPTVNLYDALNTLPTDQTYGHAQLLKFIRNRPPGTQVAIFVLGSKLHLL